MYVYLLRTLSIQIAKTKLLVKMASESGRIANMTEDLLEIIDNKDFKQTKAVIEKSVSLTIVSYILNLFISKILMRYSKTNTTWFISRSSNITGPLVLDA